ncbi:hypothetical protein GKQ77_13570 [Streptomyces sp. BG9H]|uniref:Uncharacterized protein n=1 Tax=Streptomyces anatolicus TaxID=2675858 RepID=A0ABS6YME3_9ACTN|nr:hypothetical protein [Streptomyces anatolicus]MBW5422582.1 hypothetical protein [Streptomyces anatolicus]
MSTSNPHTARSARRGLVLAALACLSLAMPAPPAHAGPVSSDSVELPPLPEARAYDGKRKPIKDYRKVLQECQTPQGKPSPCVFELKEKKEYNTAVVSVGNAVENCTDDPIIVTKEAELTSSSTDNIGGEISGTALFEGTINNTASVTMDDTVQMTGSATKQNATESTHQTWSPHSSKAQSSSTSKASSQYSATATGQNTAHVGVTDSVLVGARASFTAAFRATFSKSWTKTATETMTHKFEVRPGRTLQFGAAFAMATITGDMVNKENGKKLENFSMHTPSTANSSRLIAQAFNSQSCPDLAQQKGNKNSEQGEHSNEQKGSGKGKDKDKDKGGSSNSDRALKPGQKAEAQQSLIPGRQPVETWQVPLHR